MSDDFTIIPSPGLERAAQSCPLLESDKAKGEWVECCSQRFFPLARRIAGDDDLAMDVLQTSWIKVLESTHASFRGPTACSWVATIVANCAIDHHRKQSRRKETPLPQRAAVRGRVPNIETTTQQREILELVREIIAALPSAYSQVADLRLQKGLTSKETAEELNITVSAVKKRLSRARRMIDRVFEQRINRLRPLPKGNHTRE